MPPEKFAIPQFGRRGDTVDDGRKKPPASEHAEIDAVNLEDFSNKSVRKHMRTMPKDIEALAAAYPDLDPEDIELIEKKNALEQAADEVARHAGLPDSLIEPLKKRLLIKKELGAGAMGRVFLAQHILLDKPVALKWIKFHQPSSPDSRSYKRFLREVRSLAKIDHPNVMDVYEAHASPEGAVFFTELVKGQSLHDYVQESLAKGAPTPLLSTPYKAGVIDVAIQVARGLQAIHEQGIIHRDIKPANIMLSDSGEAKIVDFGLVFADDAAERVPAIADDEPKDPRLTRSGIWLGTASYTSPENILHTDISSESDVYSFGATLYELITSRLPFDGKNKADTVRNVLTQKQKPAIELRGDIPVGLSNIVDQMLYKDPAKRPSLERIIEALQEVKQELRASGAKARKKPTIEYQRQR